MNWSNVISQDAPGAPAQRFDGMDLFVLLLPFSRLVQFNGIGRLYGVDVLLFGALILLLPTRGRILREPASMAFLAAALVWLFGAVATDIYRDSAFQDWTRGWSKIIFFAISFMALAMIFEGRIYRAILFSIGLACSSVMEVFLLPGDFTGEYPWKFGYGPPVTLLVVIVAESEWFVRRFGRFVGVACVYAIAAVSFYLNARSVFGIAAAAATFGLAKLLLDPSFRGMRVTSLTFFCYVTAGIVFCWGVTEFQVWASEAGILGAEAQEKVRVQQSGNFGILIGGRSEVLVSTQAILDSPILGHGSWARDISYVGLLLDTLFVNGELNTSAVAMLEDDLIPSHSYLAGAWVEAGILGGLFWIYIIYLMLTACRALLAIPSRRSMFMAFAFFTLMWDILFSPFGADRRFVVPVPILLAIWMTQAERKQRSRDLAEPQSTVSASRSQSQIVGLGGAGRS